MVMEIDTDDNLQSRDHEDHHNIDDVEQLQHRVAATAASSSVVTAPKAAAAAAVENKDHNHGKDPNNEETLKRNGKDDDWIIPTAATTLLPNPSTSSAAEVIFVQSAGGFSSSSSSNSSSGFDVYASQGNASRAAELFQLQQQQQQQQQQLPVPNNQQPSMPASSSSSSSTSTSTTTNFAYRYNQSILSSLITMMDDQNRISLLRPMEDEFHSSSSSSSSLKRQRNQLIVAYNRALMLFTTTTSWTTRDDSGSSKNSNSSNSNSNIENENKNLPVRESLRICQDALHQIIRMHGGTNNETENENETEPQESSQEEEDDDAAAAAAADASRSNNRRRSKRRRKRHMVSPTETAAAVAGDAMEMADMAEVATRVGCLFVECLWTLSAGGTIRTTSASTTTTTITPDASVESILDFLDALVDASSLMLTSMATTTNTTGEYNQHYYYPKAIAQCKFLLSLYRSRVDLAAARTIRNENHCMNRNHHDHHKNHKHDNRSDRDRDARLRSARKALKQAMDMYQHKLRPAFIRAESTSNIGNGGNGGGASVVSSAASANSEDNNNHHHSHVLPQQQIQPVDRPNRSSSSSTSTSSIVLQRHNQSVLNLKAYAEQLKGNTKKSLLLLAEASNAVNHNDATAAAGNYDDDDDDHNNDHNIDAAYRAIHHNNLAVVYATMGKRHLALHALAKSLQSSAATTIAKSQGQESSSSSSSPTSSLPQPQSSFYRDGTARPSRTLMVLYNTAICALQTRKYKSAYQCLATCLADPPPPMALGNDSSSDAFRRDPRCWLRLAEACVGIFSEQLSSASYGFNGSSQWATIAVNGVPKGILLDRVSFQDHPDLTNEEPVPVLACIEDFEQVMRNPLVRARASLEHVLADEFAQSLNDEALASARLMLSYVSLAFRDFPKALDLAKLVLATTPEPCSSADALTIRRSKRRTATARMYAAESSDALGRNAEAMKYLAGDGREDAFDRLATDLSGLTLQIAAASSTGKRCLARAQAVVRSSASTVTANLGNLTAAKQLAMSAQAMEDAYNSNRERSISRRALAYTLLKGENRGAAISILRSLRS